MPQNFSRAARRDSTRFRRRRNEYERSELSTRQRSVPSHRARPRGVSSAPHEEGTDPARRSPAAPLPQAGLCLSARTALSPSAFCSMASAGRTRQPHHGHARRTRHSTPPAAPPHPCPRMRPIVHTHVHQLPSCPPPSAIKNAQEQRVAIPTSDPPLVRRQVAIRRSKARSYHRIREQPFQDLPSQPCPNLP